MQEVHVPGAAEGDADREGRGAFAADERSATAGTCRSIGDLELRDVQAFNGNRSPEVGPGEETDLLFQGELIQKAIDVGGMGRGHALALLGGIPHTRRTRRSINFINCTLLNLA